MAWCLVKAQGQLYLFFTLLLKELRKRLLDRGHGVEDGTTEFVNFHLSFMTVTKTVRRHKTGKNVTHFVLTHVNTDAQWTALRMWIGLIWLRIGTSGGLL
jgi:hypothetical protein